MTLACLNIWGWHQASLSLGLGLIYLLSTSYLLGGKTLSLAPTLWERFIWGGLIIASSISIIATILFYLNLYHPIALAGLLILLPWFGSSRPTAPTPDTATDSSPTGNYWLRIALGVTYLLLTAITFYFLNQNQTNEAIRTPWQVIPNFVFLLYGLTCGTYLTLSLTGARHPAWPVPLYALTLSLAGLVYPLGFGFDPLIHQATEKILLVTNTIQPKPLYYLGQYSLVTTLAWLWQLSVSLVDTWLVPLLVSLGLPVGLMALLRSFKLKTPWLLLLAILPLIFTLPMFTYTTPQGLADFWAIITILLLAAKFTGAPVPNFLLWLTALATLITHPLTGLPIMGLTFLWWIIKERPGALGPRHQLITKFIAVATAMAVPVAFALMSWLKPGAASLNLTTDFISGLARLGQDMFEALPWLPRLIDTPDAIYLWGRPLTLILIILAAAGWFKAKPEMSGLRFMALAFALPATGYLILRLGATFPLLEPNEQGFYSSRLWQLALLSLMPLSLWGAYKIIAPLKAKPGSGLSLVMGGSLLLTAAFYLTYPRVDVWQRYTAYNTTPADLAAVQLINKTASDTPYVVLSNQAVAAAAVREYGFNQYYQGHFYYPLPTGENPLYQIYLQAVATKSPQREVVAEAANLADVPQVYLVLNRYWANFDNLADVAQKQANDSWSVADGKVRIFRYDF